MMRHVRSRPVFRLAAGGIVRYRMLFLSDTAPPADAAAAAAARTAFFFLSGSDWKHFQRRSVSSAAADTTVLPSGDKHICSTRPV